MVLKSLLHEIEDLQCVGIEYMAGNNSGLQSQTRKEQFDIIDAFQGGKVFFVCFVTYLLFKIQFS